MKITRAKIVMLGLFIGLVVVVSYAKRDLNLDIDLLRESLLSMPDIVMENIKMTREVYGDKWQISLPYVDRNGDIVRLLSVDIRREISGDKGSWKFFGREGIYSNDIKTVSISGLSGTLENNDKVWKIESNNLYWQDGRSFLFFPEGLEISDSEFTVKTPMASIDKSGVLLLEKGGVIQWVKPRKR